jgi:hypothetical protein
MNYYEPGGTRLQVRRDSWQRQLSVSLVGHPMTAGGRLGEQGRLSWTVHGAEAERLLREMVMIAELWGVTADAEAAH